ncbi:hypothetical protein ACP70R_005897 [Stipagrostis hirtigluma subsp. patula]
MNEQMMRPPPPLPYQMWAAPPVMEPLVGFAAGKPAARPAWKRAAWAGRKRKAPPAAALAPAGARRGGAAAPRNTTSFLIRAKRAGGVASLVSPCPVTPAVLPTPRLSPAREVLVEMAKEAWGVDGYGSMKGLIRLRSQAAGAGVAAGDSDSGSGSGESDVEEHVEVERRLDHDLSRFEMVQLPAAGAFSDDDDEAADGDRAARLEEENLTLRARLFLMERDVADLRRRLLAVEELCRDRHRDGCVVDDAADVADPEPSITAADVAYVTADEAATADSMKH